MRTWLQALIHSSDAGGPYVSLFMPLHRGRTGMAQDRIRLRNLLDTAETQLAAYEVRGPDAVKLLTPARELDLASLDGRKRADALALILSADNFQAHALTYAAPELVVVAPHPHIMPLLPLLYQAPRFYILCLSQKRVQLWRSERGELAQVELPGIPHSLREALAGTEFEKFRNVRPQPRSVGGGGRQGIAYGQGSAADVLKEELTAFFHAVDSGIANALKAERAPLILACVDYLFPLYRQVNTYAALWEEFIPGNPDRAAPAKLAARARELLQPYFEETQREAKARYHALSATPRATDEIKSIVPAAHQGRVEILMLATDAPTCGEFDETRQEVLAHPTTPTRTEDLGNLAALYTLRNGGTVIPLPRAEMPAQARMAAVLRF
jgi:hypothetical protein